MTETIGIKVEGLASTLAAFKQFEERVDKGLKKELKGAAGMVAVEAKQIAEQKGLRRTGDLIRSIRPGFRSNYAYVGDLAKHGGYNYPARLEFEKHGQRAFLYPALDHRRVEIEAAVAAMVERYAREFNATGLRV